MLALLPLVLVAATRAAYPEGVTRSVEENEKKRGRAKQHRTSLSIDVLPRTPGKELEARLNCEFGPGTQPFDDMRRYVTQGLEEGWVATEEISGRVYRRSKIAEPSEQTHYLSIVTVYMESHGAGGDQEEQKVLRGRYHRHPYGEINRVVPLDDKAQLKGMQGWQGAGWTSPGPGTITTWKSGVEP